MWNIVRELVADGVTVFLTIRLGNCSIRAASGPDLRGGLSMSDRERPFLTGVNGPVPGSGQTPTVRFPGVTACLFH